MTYKDQEARRRYAREWYARRRAEWFADKECWRCGTTTDLQLDHIDPAEKASHAIWSWSAVRREAELAKCQVLCLPCHKWKTRGCGEFAVGEAHGHATLSEAEVLEIRGFVAGGLSCAEVGRRVGLDRKTVWDVVNRTWQYLNEDLPPWRRGGVRSPSGDRALGPEA